MPKTLRDLKITEVSSVDRGAGEGVQVKLVKRHGRDDAGSVDDPKPTYGGIIVSDSDRAVGKIMIGVAKAVISGRQGYPRQTKEELYKALERGAEACRRQGEAEDAAFTRFATQDDTGRLLMQAHSLVRGPQFTNLPEPVTKAAPDYGDAYGQLLRKASALRKAQPDLTEAQAFAMVYEDPSNRDLVDAQRADARKQAA
jgi:hypothetical protein